MAFAGKMSIQVFCAVVEFLDAEILDEDNSYAYPEEVVRRDWIWFSAKDTPPYIRPSCTSCTSACWSSYSGESYACRCRKYGALGTWRMLSTEERQLSDAAAKALVRCVYLRFTSPTAAFKKLDFYIKGLDLEVRSLIIFGGRNITDDDVEQLTRRCPHIRSFELWDNQHNALTDAGVELS